MLPEGVYTGRALGLFRIFNLVWRGKVFRGEVVTNRILGREMFEGSVSVWPSRVVVYYGFGLIDYLAPEGTGYRGTMHAGPLRVRFTLTKESDV